MRSTSRCTTRLMGAGCWRIAGRAGWRAMAAPRFLLHGTRGSFKKYGLDPQEPTLVGGAKVPRMGSGDDWLEEPKAAWGTLTSGSECRLIRGRW